MAALLQNCMFCCTGEAQQQQSLADPQTPTTQTQRIVDFHPQPQRSSPPQAPAAIGKFDNNANQRDVASVVVAFQTEAGDMKYVTFHDRQLGFAYKKVERKLVDGDPPKSVAIGARVSRVSREPAISLGVQEGWQVVSVGGVDVKDAEFADIKQTFGDKCRHLRANNMGGGSSKAKPRDENTFPIPIWGTGVTAYPDNYLAAKKRVGESFHTLKDGRKICYFIDDDGSPDNVPVICLHGGGEGKYMWLQKDPIPGIKFGEGLESCRM